MAFGSDHFRSPFGAFGQLGEQGRWAGTRSGGLNLAVGWVRSSDPEGEVGRGPHPHPKLEWRSHRPPAWCLGVGGVPQQLWWGGSQGWRAKSGGVAAVLSARCRSSDVLALQSAGSVRFEQFGQDRCGAVIRRRRSGEGPTHTQNWNGGLTGLPLGVCLGVGGVPHQLDGGGRVRVSDLCRPERSSNTQSRILVLDDFCVRK